MVKLVGDSFKRNLFVDAAASHKRFTEKERRKTEAATAHRNPNGRTMQHQQRGQHQQQHKKRETFNEKSPSSAAAAESL